MDQIEVESFRDSEEEDKLSDLSEPEVGEVVPPAPCTAVCAAVLHVHHELVAVVSILGL